MKQWRWLGLSLVLALIAAGSATWWLLRHMEYLQQEQQLAAEQHRLQYTRVPVVVASIALQAGAIIAEEQLRVRELDSASIPADTIHPADIYPYLGRRIGSHVHQPIPAGTPLQLVHLAPEPQLVEPDSAERQGMVVFSFALSWLESHAGMIQLADELDLYQQQQGFAELLHPRAQVVALGEQHGQRSAGGPPQVSVATVHTTTEDGMRQLPYQQVSVLVPLEQVARLTALAGQGRLLPILRFRHDGAQATRLNQGYSQDIIVPGGR